MVCLYCVVALIGVLVGRGKEGVFVVQYLRVSVIVMKELGMKSRNIQVFTCEQYSQRR
jgi:hypothetical protein